MFSTIVVGTDGSTPAEAALTAAAELAGLREGTSVHVVVAYHPLSAADLRRLAEELPEDVRPLLHAHVGAESSLTDARSIMQRAGVDAQYHEIDGDPTEALLEVAELAKADLLVVGSRGEGATKRALHGSVSTKVMHHADCAVLVVKEPA